MGLFSSIGKLFGGSATAPLSLGMAGVGGLMSAFGSRRGATTTQLPLMTPGQQSAQQQALQMAMSGMQDPTKGFEPIAQQEISRFKSQTIPGLAERFTSMGQGAQRSSGFQGALGQAGAGLGERLAGQQAQFGLQNMASLQNLLGLGLKSPFENIYQPAQMGRMQSLGGQMLGGGLQSLLGGF